MYIDTPRIKLIPFTLEILQATIKGDKYLADLMNIPIEPGWYSGGAAPLYFFLSKLLNSPEHYGWLNFLMIHKEDNKIIGMPGYKGLPIDGSAEIGYEIAPTYRNKGLITETVKALTRNALDSGLAKSVIAHTLAELNPSTSVLTKCNFIRTEEKMDPEEGIVWKWEYQK